MVAEGVDVLIVTVCVEEYVPAAGLKEGVTAWSVMVYAAEPAALAEPPEASAIALTVSEGRDRDRTGIGLSNFGRRRRSIWWCSRWSREGVDVLMVTVCVEEYVPAAGLKEGVAACEAMV